MLEALHEKYPTAQLGAVDLNSDALNALKEYYVDTGILPKDTAHFNESYANSRLVREFGQSDLIVNVAPSPDLIRSAGGARGYAEQLLNLTKQGGKVYVAIDNSTFGVGNVSELSNIFKELGAEVKSVKHFGGGLTDGNLLGVQGVFSGWITNMSDSFWIEYLVSKR